MQIRTASPTIRYERLTLRNQKNRNFYDRIPAQSLAEKPRDHSCMLVLADFPMIEVDIMEPARGDSGMSMKSEFADQYLKFLILVFALVA